MKVDRYTKFLLTVICVCLVYLCLRDLLSAAKVRADEPVRVVLVDGSDHPVAPGMGIAGRPLRVEIEQH